MLALLLLSGGVGWCASKPASSVAASSSSSRPAEGAGAGHEVFEPYLPYVRKVKESIFRVLSRRGWKRNGIRLSESLFLDGEAGAGLSSRHYELLVKKLGGRDDFAMWWALFVLRESTVRALSGAGSGDSSGRFAGPSVPVEAVLSWEKRLRGRVSFVERKGLPGLARRRCRLVAAFLRNVAASLPARRDPVAAFTWLVCLDVHLEALLGFVSSELDQEWSSGSRRRMEELSRKCGVTAAALMVRRFLMNSAVDEGLDAASKRRAAEDAGARSPWLSMGVLALFYERLKRLDFELDQRERICRSVERALDELDGVPRPLRALCGEGGLMVRELARVASLLRLAGGDGGLHSMDEWEKAECAYLDATMAHQAMAVGCSLSACRWLLGGISARMKYVSRVVARVRDCGDAWWRKALTGGAGRVEDAAGGLGSSGVTAWLRRRERKLLERMRDDPGDVADRGELEVVRRLMRR